MVGVRLGGARLAPRRGRTTPTTLRWLRLWLLAGTVAVLAAALGGFEGAHLTIDAINARGVPVVLDVLDVRQALVAANNAAADSFAVAGEVQLVGAGTAYQGQISLASQGLEQVAALNDAGPAGIAAVQSVDGQLNAYTSLIQQADAYFARGEPALGAAEDWQASQLMDNGVLNSLSGLQAAEQAAVDGRNSSFWVSTLVVVLWAGPAILLLAGLLLAQVYLARKFRRSFSLPLVLASVLLLALAAGGATAAIAEHHLTRGLSDMAQVTAERGSYTGLLDRQGREAVGGLLARQCARQPSGCGATVAAFEAKLERDSHQRDPGQLPPKIAVGTAAAATQLNAADEGYGLQFIIPAVALAVAGLVVLALRPRIDEYR